MEAKENKHIEGGRNHSKTLKSSMNLHNKLKPEDLRYNNLVEFEGEYLPVLGIQPERECKELGLKCSVTLPEMWKDKLIGLRGVWLNNIKPIPLTEDILVRCGAIEVLNNSAGVTYSFADEEGFIYDDIRITYWKKDSMDRKQGTFTFLKREIFLHDLQNIYYFHERTELTLSP